MSKKDIKNKNKKATLLTTFEALTAFSVMRVLNKKKATLTCFDCKGDVRELKLPNDVKIKVNILASYEILRDETPINSIDLINVDDYNEKTIKDLDLPFKIINNHICSVYLTFDQFVDLCVSNRTLHEIRSSEILSKMLMSRKETKHKITIKHDNGDEETVSKLTSSMVQSVTIYDKKMRLIAATSIIDLI